MGKKGGIMRGPIDYIIVGVDGPKFDGSILAAIGGAIESGAIALVALSVIAKDTEGTVTTLDIAESGDAYLLDFVQKHPTSSDLVTQDDIDEVGELLDNDSAAGLLIVEQLWAKPLKKALLDANAYLIAEGRIHPEAAAELSQEGVN